MKLYTTLGAPNPRRVSIFLAEKAIDIQQHQVDIGKGEHLTAAYAAINPLRQMPALVFDDGMVLTESVAICRYFEDIQPAPPLFGTNALDRAQVEMWQRRMELVLFRNVANVFRHSHPFMVGIEVPQIAALAEACRPRALEFLEFLDGELATRPFVAGENFTIADITGLVAVEFMRPARIRLPPALVHVSRWVAAVSARPSARAGAWT